MDSPVEPSKKSLKATLRLMRWTAWAIKQNPYQGYYYEEGTKWLGLDLKEFAKEQSQKFGQTRITELDGDQILEEYLPFLHFSGWEQRTFHQIFTYEWLYSLWGMVIFHQMLDDPDYSRLDKHLTRLPAFIMPQECVVCGEKLTGLTFKNYKSKKGGKLRLKCDVCKDGWDQLKTKFQKVFFSGWEMGDVSQIASHLHDVWEAYCILISDYIDSERPYTPRYKLFKEYETIEPEWFLRLQSPLNKELQDINLLNLPQGMFKPELAGKRLIDQKPDQENAAIYLLLEQLQDYFVEPKQGRAKKNR